LALEDAINVVCCATVLIEYVGAVGDEAPAFGKQRPGVYGRKPVAVREFDDTFAMPEDWEVCRGDETAIRPPCKVSYAPLEVINGPHIDPNDIHAQSGRRGVNNAELGSAGGRCGIPKRGHTGYGRCDLLEQFQPFRADAVFEIHEPGDVAARPRKRLDKARADRIASDWEYNRHCASRMRNRADRGR